MEDLADTKRPERKATNHNNKMTHKNFKPNILNFKKGKFSIRLFFFMFCYQRTLDGDR